MILNCPDCHTSFLVPASFFIKGARTVRCGHCHHSWEENPTPQSEQIRPFIALRKAAAEQEPTLQPSVTPLKPQKPRQPFSIRRVLENLRLLGIKLLRALLFLALFLAGLALLTGASMLLFREQILPRWPQTVVFYKLVGANTAKKLDPILLENIQSARLYQDGAMHLVVQGTIRSTASKVLVLPKMKAEALDLSGHVIQSWQIDPPVATLAPGATATFRSAILSPEGIVTEVNLRFVEQVHDEP